MGLFSSRRRKDEPAPETRPASGAADFDDEDDGDELFDEKSAPADRARRGPFDSSEANPAKRYVDLGALRIPAKPGLGLRLEVEERTRELVAVALDFNGSTMQVQAFAAPRSEGLWHGIRRQLREQVVQQGGKASEAETDLGLALDARIPVQARANAGGVPVRPARFIGVDGPRWFLRGVITGQALREPRMLAEIEELFRSIVVHRGDGPMPPRDLLTLVVPKAMAEQVGAAGGPGRAGAPGPGRTAQPGYLPGQPGQPGPRRPGSGQAVQAEDAARQQQEDAQAQVVRRQRRPSGRRAKREE